MNLATRAGVLEYIVQAERIAPIPNRISFPVEGDPDGVLEMSFDSAADADAWLETMLSVRRTKLPTAADDLRWEGRRLHLTAPTGDSLEVETGRLTEAVRGLLARVIAERGGAR